jgi:antagonist of KipI
MSVKIIHSGFQSSLQDRGRFGFQYQGIPPAGPMDSYCFSLSNMLVGNDINSPVIECTGAGLTFVAETDLLVSLCGGGSVLTVNGEFLPSFRPIKVKAFAVIQLVKAEPGFRSYLAVYGGFKGTNDLGSVSTYPTASLGGINGNFLTSGTILETNNSFRETRTGSIFPGNEKTYIVSRWGLTEGVYSAIFSNQVRVIKGPEWNNFKDADKLFDETFTVSEQSGRMGYRLSGPSIVPVDNFEMTSTAVTAGIIQCTPGGSLMLLMADTQTTGGYPRIARVAAVDLCKCAQLKPGSKINFVLVSTEAAEELYLKREMELARLEHIIDLRYDR